jgi:flavin-dependent dehydrogenase
MEQCDVLVVGGGPAGSSLAWGLRESGLDVVVVDRKTFPRDKICAGWVTPEVLGALDVDVADYAKERVIQPVEGFRVSMRGHRPSTARWNEVVSYGIRRCEFDDYLLSRCGARLRLGEPIRDLRREGGAWTLNGELSAPLLFGAGGHFCPVARLLGARPGSGEPTVVARELEFEMTPEQQRDLSVPSSIPELFFEQDLKGYGWLVRKGDWLNVGLGRQDTEALGRHVEGFLGFLKQTGRMPFDLPRAMKGHAYLLHDQSPRPLRGDGVLLIGDAAGMAYGRSGEGIRPAVESALLAAHSITAHRDFDGAARAYEAAVTERLGDRHAEIRPGITDKLPERWRGPIVARLLANERFARKVMVGRWFLHREQAVLRAQ